MSEPVFDLDAAVALATAAHDGQTDKAGAAYIGHPLRVMARVDGDDARMVAVLHDVIEDTPVTAADLLALGCPAAVVDAVEALSKRPGETLDESMRRVAEHRLAIVVKHADLDDNSDPQRLALLPPDLADRLREKYRRSRELLEAFAHAASVRQVPADEYLDLNRTNWDSRAAVHAQSYGIDELLADPDRLSAVVEFDRPRLGDVAGLDVVHLQCHLGTDTLSLARLGARVTGVDLSGASLDTARSLATRAGEPIEYVQSDVYAAPEALDGRRFDLVYTGIGAICWLPSIRRWAETVATLLRPGGRLFIRDGHPVLLATLAMTVGAEHEDREQQHWITGPQALTPALELPYFEQTDPLVWSDDYTYGGADKVEQPRSMEWNHGLGEIVTALLDAGLELTSLTEHDSVPWDALPGLMVLDEDVNEYRLRDRPERLPATFTLTARRR